MRGSAAMVAQDLERFAPVALHFFRGRYPDGTEVYLSAGQVFLEASLSLCGSQGVVAVESGFPKVAALGSLPAGYVEGRPVATSVLLHLAKHHGPAAPNVSALEVWALLAQLETVLSRMVNAALWLHAPAYRHHTVPAVRSGLGPALPFVARWFCWRHRRQISLALAGEDSKRARKLAVTRAVAEFAKLLPSTCRFDERCARLRSVQDLRLDDLALYAHARVLLNVPASLAPWPADLPGLCDLQHFVAEVSGILPGAGAAGGQPSTPQKAWLGHGKACDFGKLLDSLAKNELDVLGKSDGADELEKLAAEPLTVQALARGLAGGATAAVTRAGAWVRSLRATSGQGSPAGGDNPRAPSSAKAELGLLSKQQVNLLFAAWWAVSMGSFAAWHLLRERKAKAGK